MTACRFPPPWTVEGDLCGFIARARRIRGHAALQEVRRIGNKDGGSSDHVCWYKKRGVSMPRYFVKIHKQDRVEDDPEGTYLPDVAAALSYAEYTIRELRKKSGYDDLALMMFVKDEARQTVLSLPFFPGC